MLEKLGVRSRTEAVSLGVRKGLVALHIDTLSFRKR